MPFLGIVVGPGVPEEGGKSFGSHPEAFSFRALEPEVEKLPLLGPSARLRLELLPLHIYVPSKCQIVWVERPVGRHHCRHACVT